MSPAKVNECPAPTAPVPARPREAGDLAASKGCSPPKRRTTDLARVPSTPSTARPENSRPPLDPVPRPGQPPQPVAAPLPVLGHAPMQKLPEAAPTPIGQRAYRALVQALDAEPAVHPALEALRAGMRSSEPISKEGESAAATRTVALTGFALERLLQNADASSLVRRSLNGRAIVLRFEGGALKLQLVTGGSLPEGGVLHLGVTKDPGVLP